MGLITWVGKEYPGEQQQPLNTCLESPWMGSWQATVPRITKDLDSKQLKLTHETDAKVMEHT